MQIFMLHTRYGSEDGFVVRRFLENHHYEVADSLGAYFIRIGVCRHPVECEALAQDLVQL
ncbi:MAG: hypothetical protein AABY33_07620 [Pseudomonadota bacterium]